jgi:hypothetical protein
MFAVEDAVHGTVFNREGRDRRRRTPVFVLCSPRPRVGRTLIARLLTEYFLADGRPVTAFDANPQDPVLSEYLPDHTLPATIADTASQMALFDQLIADDAVPKVVDLANGLFGPFFDVARDIGFVEEARARSVDLVVLFVADHHAKSVEAYGRLLERHPQIMLVPVQNEAIIKSVRAAEFPPARAGAAPLRVAALSPVLHAFINKPGFSFADYLHKPAQYPTELHTWINRSFIAFRDLELRLLLEEFRTLFRHPEWP